MPINIACSSIGASCMPIRQHPWDKLCDALHGAGVPDLNEALVRLRLKPVSDALRAVLDPALIRTMAELSELEDVTTGRDAHVLKSSAIQKKRQEFFETICDRGCVFFHQAYRHASKPASGFIPINEPEESAELAVHLRSILRKVMRIPQMEDGLYPEQREALAPWSVEARRVLPSRSPRIDSTAVWAPALGWALLLRSRRMDRDPRTRPRRRAIRHEQPTVRIRSQQRCACSGGLNRHDVCCSYRRQAVACCN